MDTQQIVVILMYATLALIVLGLLMMLVFGIVNLVRGKMSPLSLIAGGVMPLAIFGIIYLASGADLAVTVVVTALVMMVSAFAALLIGFFRGLLPF